MKQRLWLFLITVITVNIPARAQNSGANKPPTLCKANETVIFSCPIGKKIVSVCQGMRNPAEYRYGTRKRIELIETNIRKAHESYASGYAQRIYFDRPPYRYFIFDDAWKAGWDDEGHSPLIDQQGVVIKKNGRVVSQLNCSSRYYAMIDDHAAHGIPTGSELDDGVRYRTLPGFEARRPSNR